MLCYVVRGDERDMCLSSCQRKERVFVFHADDPVTRNNMSRVLTFVLLAKDETVSFSREGREGTECVSFSRDGREGRDCVSF